MRVKDLAQALSQLVSQGHGDADVMVGREIVSGYVVRDAERVVFSARGRRKETITAVEVLTDVPF